MRQMNHIFVSYSRKNEKTVERAKENIAELSNITLILEDFYRHVFCEQFDIIYSSLTFMHFKDKQKGRLLNDLFALTLETLFPENLLRCKTFSKTPIVMMVIRSIRHKNSLSSTRAKEISLGFIRLTPSDIAFRAVIIRQIKYNFAAFRKILHTVYLSGGNIRDLCLF